MNEAVDEGDGRKTRGAIPVTSAIGSTACLELLACAIGTIFDGRGL
jgi:hypothetical protein